MKSTTSLIARQCRIQEWAGQVKECNQRPEGMSVDEWCQQHDITKTTYYYRLRQVRKACLDNISQDKLPLENAFLEVPDTVYFKRSAPVALPSGFKYWLFCNLNLKFAAPCGVIFCAIYSLIGADPHIISTSFYQTR